MPRGPYESLDDYSRRRRGPQTAGERIGGMIFAFVIVGSAGLAIIHGGWVRFVLLGILPAIVVLGLCARLYRIRWLRVIVAPIAALILFGFPAFWADALIFALSGSWTWSTGVAIVVLFATVPVLAALRTAQQRRRAKDRSDADASSDSTN